MTDKYTPGLKHVRRAATDFGTPITPDEFDRWLEEHDREVAERAWDEGWDKAERFGYPSEDPEFYENPYRKETT